MSPAAQAPIHGWKARLLVPLMALGCGIIVANLYYAQPIVALIGADLGMPPQIQSLVVTFGQLGYAAGLILLVPLGDIAENRRLITWTGFAAVAALLVTAFAPNAASLLAANFALGAALAAAQMIVPFAASLAPPAARGRVVGNVMAGLLGGILVARPLAAVLAGAFGWRAVFLISAVATLLVIVALRLVLPERRPDGRARYTALLASLPGLVATQPILRRRALYHAAMFATFAIFWTGVPLVLLREPFNLSQNEIALFALAGVLGVLAAPIAGRLADRGHTRSGTIAAMILGAGAMALAFAGERSIAALVIAGILVDLGVQANLVIGQREIYQLGDAIRSRVNAIYITTFFLGGAFGSAITSPILENFGWRALMVVATVPPLLALCAVLTERRR